ncbi:DUF1998 domain-containing protein [Pseudozobellia thermophila]|uniref:MrfA-like Zn-binding domain-containing protein n=1 Tax=Pseudozobellia thermophila TaxID=192903 RepID=A0A1M6BDP9_9FLAO|nr:DUF1998 domain-containing protein [Pseudozobellia thermophila]SHI46688.1 protein of unknown function [Pseudozobellia thermophila]
MNRNIRLGQLLSPFGIGQLVNFPNDESLMICGLDAWDLMIEQRMQNAGNDHIDFKEFEIREPRLEQLLGVSSFRKPFPFRKNSSKNSRLTIPGVRFPQWHYCIRCGVMRQIELNRQQSPRCTSGECSGRLIPVRFVAVCPQGHIQDVPFLYWVHPDGMDDQRHILTYSAGKGSGDLSSIVISCSCGQRRTLGGIMNEGALDTISTCSGHRPWLGPIGIRQPQPCEHSLRVLIKGSSNVHYALIKSALYLPQAGDTTPEMVQRIIEREEETLRNFHEMDNDGRILKVFLKTQAEVKSGRIALDELLEYVLSFLESGKGNADLEINSDFDIRIQEYQYLNTGRDSENSDFKALVKPFSSTEEGVFLSEYFDHVVLIEKLRETRVFAGFSRLNSEDGRLVRDKINDLSIKDKDWLPAHVVYGEGIFIKFSDDKLDEWLSRANNNLEALIARYHKEQARRIIDYQNRDLTPSFILLHTFAHLLINRLCYNCGYGSSSLRERIYFSSSRDNRMNGVLIYTSSGDSEGSMGGLVRQGRELNFYRLVKEIIEDARWCSADPVCMDVGSSMGQGPDSLNGAACHNCAIVPETSCEEFNKLLDRSALVGTYEDFDSGFFN